MSKEIGYIRVTTYKHDKEGGPNDYLERGDELFNIKFISRFRLWKQSEDDDIIRTALYVNKERFIIGYDPEDFFEDMPNGLFIKVTAFEKNSNGVIEEETEYFNKNYISNFSNLKQTDGKDVSKIVMYLDGEKFWVAYEMNEFFSQINK
jgi:hypothetical protein